MYYLFYFFWGGRRYSADECSVDTGRKSLTFDLYDKKLSESIHDVQKKFHEITVCESSTVKGKYLYSQFFFYNFVKENFCKNVILNMKIYNYYMYLMS